MVPIACWGSAFLVWRWNSYAFKKPTTRLVPTALRHTWFAGLSIITCSILVALPGWLLGFPLVASLTLIAVLFLSRKKGVKLFIEDLKFHRMEGRGLFQHSEGCYMVGGGLATFVIKRREKLRGNPASNQDLTGTKPSI